jgi:hypothetical protein
MGDQLQEFVQEKFQNERSQIAKILINSFSRCLDAVIARKG